MYFKVNMTLKITSCTTQITRNNKDWFPVSNSKREIFHGYQDICSNSGNNFAIKKFINHSYILDYEKVYSRMLHVHDLWRMPNERSEDFQRNKMRVINLICANINTHANVPEYLVMEIEEWNVCIQLSTLIRIIFPHGGRKIEQNLQLWWHFDVEQEKVIIGSLSHNPLFRKYWNEIDDNRQGKYENRGGGINVYVEKKED